MKQQEENKIEDENLPGYPHYPTREDITDPRNNTVGVSFNDDLNKQQQRQNAAQVDKQGKDGALANTSDDTDDDDTEIVMGTEADVTEEDLLLLGPEDGDMDMGEDEEINYSLDETDMDGDPLNENANDLDGSDLDIPDSEDNATEALGQGDEENDYYSLSDNQDDKSE